jgi:hypothetical protein
LAGRDVRNRLYDDGIALLHLQDFSPLVYRSRGALWRSIVAACRS